MNTCFQILRSQEAFEKENKIAIKMSWHFPDGSKASWRKPGKSGLGRMFQTKDLTNKRGWFLCLEYNTIESSRIENSYPGCMRKIRKQTTSIALTAQKHILEMDAWK